MTGYAPNPSSVENASASLTSGLLARKGHATPAVDAVAHEGVDIDMQPMPSARPPRLHAEDGAVESVYRNTSGADAEAAPVGRDQGRRTSSQAYRQRSYNTLDAAPENWTVTSESALRPRPQPAPLRQKSRQAETAAAGGLRAMVKFRMPAADFIRLRIASRDMRESCQTIIIDAIAAYLDANDVELVDEATTRLEVERLVQKRADA